MFSFQSNFFYTSYIFFLYASMMSKKHLAGQSRRTTMRRVAISVTWVAKLPPPHSTVMCGKLSRRCAMFMFKQSLPHRSQRLCRHASRTHLSVRAWLLFVLPYKNLTVNECVLKTCFYCAGVEASPLSVCDSFVQTEDRLVYSEEVPSELRPFCSTLIIWCWCTSSQSIQVCNLIHILYDTCKWLCITIGTVCTFTKFLGLTTSVMRSSCDDSDSDIM